MRHTRYSGYKLSDENMDNFVCSTAGKVIDMSDWNSKDYSDSQSLEPQDFDENLNSEQDWLMEQILENINSTPIGQVLKKIASLPEVRREKVIEIRRQITDGEYDLNNRLEIAIDKILEDLIV